MHVMFIILIDTALTDIYIYSIVYIVYSYIYNNIQYIIIDM